TSTRSPSPPTPTGADRSHPRPRSRSTSGGWRPTSGCGPTSGSVTRCSAPPGTRPTGAGGCGPLPASSGPPRRSRPPAPCPDRPFRPAERLAFRHLPLVQRLARAGIYWGREQMVAGFVVAPGLMRATERLARRHLQRFVPDPVLRAKLTPDYRIGCKRILISNHYLPSLT